MHTIRPDHVIILPHAEAYRVLYNLSLDDVALTINSPELREGVSSDRFTAEKTIGTNRIYLYYYLIPPLIPQDWELYAIIDFIGFSPIPS